MKFELSQAKFNGRFVNLRARKTARLCAASTSTAARLLAFSAAACGLSTLAHVAHADVYGNNGGINLNLPGSWTDETNAANTGVLAPGATDIARWDSLSTGGTFNLSGPISYLGLSIANPTAAVTIGSAADNSSGGALTIGASGIDMSAATQSLIIADSLTTSASQSQLWNVNSGNSLTITGTTNLSSSVLTISGAGSTVFGSTSTTGTATSNLAVISGSGGIIKTGTGTLTFSSVETYTGGITVTNGTLVANIAGADGASTSAPNLYVTPGAVNLSGGTFLTTAGTKLSGSSSQFAYVDQISTLNLLAGDSALMQTHQSNARTINTLNNITRTQGATLSLTDAFASSSGTNGGGYRAKNINDTGNSVVNGIIPFIDYTTAVNTTSWFAPYISGTTTGINTNGTAYSAFNSSSGTALGNGSSGQIATQNIDINTAATTTPAQTTIVPSSTVVNSIRLNNITHSYTLSVTDTLTIASGGILITGGYGSHSGNITGGILEGGNPGSGSGNDLIIIDLDDPAVSAGASFTIGSAIDDNTTNGNTNGLATALTKSGPGTLILTSSASNYSGGTFLNGGVISIAADASLGNLPTTPTANLMFNGGTIEVASSFNINSNRKFVLADKGGGFNAPTGVTSSFSGLITGTGALTKSGAGTLRLPLANTYSGGTIVAGGILSVDNTTGSATGAGGLTVNALATLTGSGIVSGPVTLVGGTLPGLGGHLAPGDGGVGNIAIGALTLNSGSAVDFEFNSDSVYDTLNVSGGVTITGGGVDLYQTGTTSPYSSTGTHTYNLISYNGTVSGLSNLTWINQVVGFNYNFSSVSTGGNTGLIEMTISGAPAAVLSQWNTAANNQNWSVAGNWTAGVPHNAGDSANFNTVTGQTTPLTVNLDAAESVGMLNFNNSTYGYTIQATTGSLTFDSGVQTTAAQLNDFGGSHTITAPITLNSNLIVTTTNPTDVLTINGNISGNATVTLGSLVGTGNYGTLVLTGSNTYTGNTIISAGNTLQLGSSAISTSGTLGGTSLTDNGVFVINRSNTFSYAGNITGTGSLVQAGAGVTTLSGTNTYSGATNISGGTLQLGSATAFAGGPLIVGASGTLDLNGYNLSTSALSGAGTIDNLTAGGSLQLTVTSGTAATFSGSIRNTSGGVAVNIFGSGALTLSGSNTYGGNTNVGSGTTNSGSLIVTGTIGGGTTRGAFTAGDIATVNVNGGTINATSFGFGDISNTAISVTGGGSINVSTGVLAADNDNTSGGYGTGYLSIVNGTVTANSATIGRTTQSLTAIVTNGATTTQGIYVNGGTLNIATTLGIGTTTNSSATMRMDAGSTTVGGVTDITLSATSGRYSVLDLSGGTFTSNDPSGVGILIGGGSFATPSAELLVRGTAVVNTPAITLGTSSQTGGNLVLELLGGTIYVGSGGIVNGSNGVSPTVNFGGTNVATAPTLAASASWSSPVSMNLTDSSSGLAPIVQAANSSGGAETVTLSGYLYGSGGLTKTGSGVLILAQNNAYSGATTVNAGTLVMANGLGSVSNGNVTINAGGAVVVQQSSISTVNALVAQGYNANGGYWNGQGFNSSSAAADTTHLTALGTILNDNPANTGTALVNTFEGAPTIDGDVLVKYTYYGDTNLNGTVDGSDYSRIDAAYINNQNTSNPALTGWFNGDFNYDGAIDGSDYTLMDNAFNSQTAVFSASIAAQLAGSAGGSAVPEPASLGIVAMSLAGLLGRRRRS
jgi:autotransporter-associated beta strand protein